MENHILWWNNLTPTEKQEKTNKYYCVFRQMFWKDVPNEDIQRMCHGV